MTDHEITGTSNNNDLVNWIPMVSLFQLMVDPFHEIVLGVGRQLNSHGYHFPML